MVGHLSPPGLREFLKSFAASLLTKMSGPASVPFIFLALIVENRLHKMLFAALAIICAFSSSYLVWRRERERARELAQKLSLAEARPEPLLDIVFDPSCSGCRYEHSAPAGGTGPAALPAYILSLCLLRFGVRNLGNGTARSVQAKLMSFKTQSWITGPDPDAEGALGFTVVIATEPSGAEAPPQPRTPSLPLPARLAIKDDHSDEGKPVDIHPSGEDHTVHIDLAPVPLNLPPFKRPLLSIFFHLRPASFGQQLLELGHVEGTLLIEGENIKAITQRFSIAGDEEDRPIIRWVGR